MKLCHQEGRLFSHSSGQNDYILAYCRRAVTLDQFFETGLVEANLARLQLRDSLFVVVDARYSVPEVGETGPAHEPDVASADNGDVYMRTARVHQTYGRATACGIADSWASIWFNTVRIGANLKSRSSALRRGSVLSRFR